MLPFYMLTSPVLEKIDLVNLDNDEWVPLSEERVFKEKLGAKTQVIHDQDHFDDMKELPEALELLP